MKPVKIKVLYQAAIVATVLLSLGKIVTAQEETPTVDRDVFLFRNGEVEALNVTTGAAQSIASGIQPLALSQARTSDETIDRRFYAADLSMNAQLMYLIEAWGRNTERDLYNLPTGSELVEVNLRTNERRVIFDDAYSYNFFLSPDERQMVVMHYAGEFLNSRPRACVLDLQTLACQPLDFDYVGSYAYWIDNVSFIFGVADANPLRLINTQTRQIETLAFPSEWYIYATPVLIPDSRKILVSATPRESPDYPPASLLTYDLDTGVVEQLPYSTPNFQEFPLVDAWAFSPDGRYLLYQGTVANLVEFATGRLIQRFESIFAADWLDNETLLIQGSREGDALELFRINAASGQITPLLSGEAAGGILLVP
jgi:hypothetical protein